MNVIKNKYAEFYNKGFQIIPDVLDVEQTIKYKNNLLKICTEQELEFGTRQWLMSNGGLSKQAIKNVILETSNEL